MQSHRPISLVVNQWCQSLHHTFPCTLNSPASFLVDFANALLPSSSRPGFAQSDLHIAAILHTKHHIYNQPTNGSLHQPGQHTHGPCYQHQYCLCDPPTTRSSQTATGSGQSYYMPPIWSTRSLQLRPQEVPLPTGPPNTTSNSDNPGSHT